MLHARGDICLFTDADLSSPISEARKLFDAIGRGADIAIGSRWLRAELQTERQPLYRQAFGRIFNLVLRVILGLRFTDTQCGFKAFRRDAAQRIFPLQKIERWGFDPEILFLARRAGLRVDEVPVLWAHSEGTRLHPFRDGMRMFVEVLRIRWYAMTGEYATGAVPSPGKLEKVETRGGGSFAPLRRGRCPIAGGVVYPYLSSFVKLRQIRVSSHSRTNREQALL